ncbi:MAG: AMP-binding protein [Eubacteriales bacterium]|nr:AMP-binding protein [Eubacteriales bacterium]
MSGLFLDNWIKEKIDAIDCMDLTRERLEQFQLKKLNETISHAIKNSRFYNNKLKNFKGQQLKNINEIENLPFTTAKELSEHGKSMLCVPANHISRIVTLNTSGSTGESKRVYFTREDQELTIDYFHHGMKNLVDENDTVLILLPCQRPGSVGDLLNTGLKRLGCRSVPFGLPDITDTEVLNRLCKIIETESITSFVGSPQEAVCLAKFWKELHGNAPGFPGIKTVLLSTDYISDETARELEEIWGCKVFEHYGMTEMGLGGAVSCETLVGYHPRENDLYFEIIDPGTGIVVPEGECGEIVFTTLTRKGMPLIRYRTGDLSKWIIEQCPCGSVLKRLNKVFPRWVK